MVLDNTENENKLRDIENVSFGDNLDEVISSMEILVMLFEISDDQEILSAIKKRMQEGIVLLKEMNYSGLNNLDITQ